MFIKHYSYLTIEYWPIKLKPKRSGYISSTSLYFQLNTTSHVT